MSDDVWDSDSASNLYQVESWASSFFSINAQGHVGAITGDGQGIDLKLLCDDLADRGLRPPCCCDLRTF